MSERAILAPKNVQVNAINYLIQEKLPGAVISYKSIDSALNEDDAVNYPVEFLNSLEPPGIPPHFLNLKVGSSIILLRNLNAPKLCNGTRLAVKRLMPNLIEATILTGKAKGEFVLIPRIPLIPCHLNSNGCNSPCTYHSLCPSIRHKDKRSKYAVWIWRSCVFRTGNYTWPVQELALQIVYLCMPQMDKQRILFTQMCWINNKEFRKNK